jgi:hydrolase, NUDIX family
VENSQGGAKRAQTTQPKATQLVVGAVVVDDLRQPTRFLAAQRAYPAQLRGQWEFPGGKVEPGEVPQAALARELREELDIVVKIGVEVTPDKSLSTWPLKPGLEMRVWLVSTDRPEISPGTSHMQVKWVTPVQALDLNWLAPDLPIVRQIIKLMAAGQGKCVQS